MVTAQWMSLCSLRDVHYWCHVWMALLEYFQRYSWFCDVNSCINHLWRHQFLSKNFNISGMKKDLSKKKVPFLFTFKRRFKQANNFLLHRHFKQETVGTKHLWNRPYAWLHQIFKIHQEVSFTLNFFSSFGRAYSSHVGILFNCAALGFSSCLNLQVRNSKTRLGGEISQFDVNTHKGYSPLHKLWGDWY